MAMAIALTAIGLFMGVWLVLSGGEDRTDHLPEATLSDAAKEMERQLVSQGLRALRQQHEDELEPLALTQGKPEPMPLSMRRVVIETIGPAPQLDLEFDQAQYVRTPEGAGLWVVEGRGVTCAFRDETGTSSCGTTIETRRRGLLLATYRLNGRIPHRIKQFTLLGIAPNDVTAVLVTSGGIARTIPVQNHLYAASADRPVKVLRLIR